MRLHGGGGRHVEGKAGAEHAFRAGWPVCSQGQPTIPLTRQGSQTVCQAERQPRNLLLFIAQAHRHRLVQEAEGEGAVLLAQGAHKHVPCKGLHHAHCVRRRQRRPCGPPALRCGGEVQEREAAGERATDGRPAQVWAQGGGRARFFGRALLRARLQMLARTQLSRDSRPG